MKVLNKIDMKTRRIIRRAFALVLAVVLVAGVGLSYSSDRLLRAEELATNASLANEKVVTDEKTVEAESKPAPEPEEKAPEPAPEPEKKVEAPAPAPEPEKKAEEPAKQAETSSAPAASEKGASGGAKEEASEEIVLGTQGTEDATGKDAAEEDNKEPEEETWVVSFYDGDAKLLKKVEVVKGKAIGDKMPAPVQRENYTAHWAIGKITGGGQGNVTKVTGDRITKNYKPSSDTVVVPDYDKITHTVTFYDSKDGEVIDGGVKKVDADTNYCLNDIPLPPSKDGYSAKWVYSGGDFTNSVVVNKDMSVWAEFDQNVFTVRFKVGDKTYNTDTYFSGDSLELPSEPAAEGRTFAGWFEGDTEYKGGEAVHSDLTLTAKFSDQYSVTFVVDNGNGEPDKLTQYFRTEGQTVGAMPQDPFVAGKVFEKWVDAETGESVTAATVVDRNITVEARFREIAVYKITAKYYYMSDSNEEVTFSTDLIQVETSQLPYTLTAPASIQTDPNKVSGAPAYFPETPSVSLEKKDFDADGKATVRIKYVKRTATYDVVYMLKNLDGNGYTEIERVSGVQGVLNSYVTPPVKAYDYYELELAESAKITKASGQEVKVLYERKNVQLSFETNGGSYVGGVTAPYGSKVTLPDTDPEKDGYSFGGWYSDQELTKKVTGPVTLNGDTTLYAGWTGSKVNYTIVYMCEKYNDSGTSSTFVYDNSKTATAQVGATVNASSAPAYNKALYEADSAQNAGSSVVIAADGSSVLKVYYKLKEYTFKFNAGKYNSYNVTATLTGLNVSGTGDLSYTIKVKPGQDISALWPSNATGTYKTGGWFSSTNQVAFNGWLNSSENVRYVTKRTTVTEDMLPKSGNSITYTAQWTTSSSASTYTVNYWLQNADNDDYTVSDVYSQTYTSSGGTLSAKDISGYTYDHGNSGASGTKEYNFYYNRDTFKIDYFYGSKSLRSIDNVKFDASIAADSYKKAPSAEGCDVDEDYVFAGWYDNSGCQGDPYAFDRMPAGNLLLYAKWTAPSYTVSFADPEDASYVPAESQTVEKYKKAEKPANPVKTGYAFDGWYKDAGGKTLFDWNTQITADTTVYAHWARKNIKYIVRYIDEEGNALASDKEVSSPNLVTGQTVTEIPVAVAGYRPAESSKTLVLAEEDNVIEFVYSAKSEVTSYKVRYLLDPSEGCGSDVAVAEEKIVENVPGDTSSVIETAAPVDYGRLYAAIPKLEGIEFHPDEAQKTLVLSSDQSGSVLTFLYTGFKHAEVKVHFVDMAGNKIAADDVQKLKVGRTFTLDRAVIEGWELDKAVSGSSYDGDLASADYKITEENADSGLEFTLFYQKKATITALSAVKQYDTKELALPEGRVRAEGLLEGHSLASVEFTYENADADNGDGRLSAGVTTVTPRDAVIAGAPTDNYYAIRYISGTLEVTKINVTVRVEPDRWTGAVYTGEEYRAGFTNPDKDVSDYVIISHEGYSKEYLDTIWNTIKSKATYDEAGAGLKYYCVNEKNAGDYSYSIGLTTADLPKDDNYSVNMFVRQGRLNILPKEASVVTESAAKGYDGTALTNESASITGLVAADEGKVTVKGTGSQTEPGSSENAYSINWGDVNEGNYNITSENLGTLTVTPGAVVLTAASASKVYDGKALTAPEVTATGLPKGFTVEATATGTQTDAGSSLNSVDDGYVIRNADGADVTGKFTVSERVDGTLTVNRAPLTIVTGSASKPYDGSALTNGEASIDGLVNGETATASATGSQTEPGSCSNTYSVNWGTAKPANYFITENQGVLTVTESSVEVTLTAPSASKTYDGKALSADGTGDAKVVASGLPKGFTVEATASGSQTNAGSSANVVNDGYVIRNAAGADKTSNFKNIALIDGTLTVNKAPVTVTTGSASKAYDGAALTNGKAEITGLVEGETAEVTATGSQTEIGSSDNTAAVNWGTAKAGNYQVTENLGTLTVSENNNAVTLTAPSATKVYDGEALKADGRGDAKVTASGLPEGFTVEATASGEQKDAGTSANVVDDLFVIRNAAGNDRTNCFTNVVKAVGSLTVSKAELAITTAGASKEYDGAALTNDKVTVTGLVEGETAEVKATGSQTEPGSSDNTYSIEWGSAKSGNYAVSEELGTLLVTENSTEVTITAPSASKTYDGTALTADGTGDKKTEVSGLPAGFTVDAVIAGTQTDAGTSENIIESYVIRNAAGADKTAGFTNVKTVNGTLTVEPKDAKVTTAGAEKKYDGKALTNADASIEGLVPGEAAEVVAGGSITEPGTADNTYDIRWGSVNAANYKITEELGKLTVTENDVKVTLTAPSDTKIYDGTALTADGKGDKKVVASGLPEGFTAEATASGEQTDAGESANTVDDGYVIRNTAGEDKTAFFTNVTKEDGTLTVAPKPVTVTTGSASKPYDGKALTNSDAAIEGLASGETAGIEATGSIKEKGSKPNSYKIAWSANGNNYSAKESNYTVTENLGTLTITDSEVEVTLTAPSAHKTYDGAELTADGTDDNKVVAGGLPEGFTVEATASGSQRDAGTSANVVDSGYVIRDASGDDKTANFKNVALIDGTLTVNPKTVTVSTGDASKPYDGTALTNTAAAIDGIVPGETYGLEVTGTVTEVGSEPNGYGITWAAKGNTYTAKADNYTVVENLGTLTVTANGAEIVFAAESGEKVYDGEALSNPKVNVSGLPAGFTAEATAKGSQKDAGESVNTVASGYVIKNAEGDNKTANFTNIKIEDGLLTVTKAPLTISTGSAKKAYDGTDLTNSEVTYEGLVSGEKATVRATGSQKEVGSSNNTYTIDWGLFRDGRNYEIIEKLGILEVTANDSEIVLAAPDAEKIYDGTALTPGGSEGAKVTASGLPEGFTVEATASGSQKDAGTGSSTVDDGYAILDSARADKTSFFTNIKKADGTLRVKKRNVTLTSADAEKVYDGSVLTNSSIEVGGDGFAPGEGASYNVTGSQKDAGTSANSFTYTLDGGAKADNYVISKKEGTLTVTAVEGKVTVDITEHSGNEKYDGSVKTVKGFDAVSGNALYKVGDFEFSGNDSVSGTNAGTYDMEIRPSDFTNTSANFSNVEFAIKDGTLTIGKRAVALRSASAKKIYDGIPLRNHEISVTGDGFAQGEGAAYSVTGSQTVPGASSNEFTYTLNDGVNKDNYDVSTAFGTLTVTGRPDNAKYEVTVQAAGDTALYDGSEHSVSGLIDGISGETVKGSVNVSAGGHKYTISGLEASASGTDAGTYEASITGAPVVKDEKGNDVTSEFIVRLSPGTLTINKRSVILTSASDSRKYNGKALTNDKIEVNGDDFAPGEGAAYTVTGSQTLVGSSANTFTYTLNDGTKASNYDITTSEGMLTVTSRDAKYAVTVQAKSGSSKYDGNEKTVEGFETLEFLVDGSTYTVEGITSGVKAKNAGTYTAAISGTPLVRDEKGNDVSAEFAIDMLPGTLEITKRNVILTSADAVKDYDGDSLTNGEVTVGGDGFAEGEGATFNVSGSRILPGFIANLFTYLLNEGVNEDNYNITVVPGTLTVNDRADDKKFEITLEANGGIVLYDGEEHEASGFKTTTFTFGNNTYEVSGISAGVTAKDAGTYPVTVNGAPTVTDSAGNDVTSQFKVNVSGAELVIKKRSVTLTSGSESRAYNGKFLTNDEVTVTGDGFVKGEGARYTVTGRQLTAGMSENTFDYTLIGITKADNYTITKAYGQLTVTSRNAKYSIVLRPVGMETMYDGTEKTVEGFSTLEFEVDGSTYTVEGVTAGRTERDAGTYPVNVTGNAVVRDADGNDVTGEFELTSTPTNLAIGKRSVTLTSGSAEKAYDGSPLTNTDVAIGGDGFAEGEGASFAVTGTRTLPGAASNSFTYMLNVGTNADNYDISTEAGTLTVTSRPEDAKYEVTVKAASGSALYDGSEHSVRGFVDGINGETVTDSIGVSAGGHKYKISGLSASASATSAGTYTVGISGTPVVTDKDGNDVSSEFMVRTESGSLVIGKRNVTLTSGSGTQMYNGKALTKPEVAVSGDGFASGEGASYNVTGSRTIVGSIANSFTYKLDEGTDAANYNITTAEGTLTVISRDAKYEITVKANGGSFLYDGTEKTAEGFETLEFEVAGSKYTVEGLSAGISAKDAGEYRSVVTGTAVVKDEQGNDVSDQFAVITQPGTLSIAKRSVTLTSADAEKVYDGKALRSDKVAVGGDGFAEGEGATYLVTGARTLPGSSSNTFTYTLNEGTDDDNYDITVRAGTLTVTDRADDKKFEITLEANGGAALYDGSEHSVSGFRASSFEIGGATYTVSGISAGVTAKDAGTYPAVIRGAAVVTDEGGNDVTSQFKVNVRSADLVINKRSVTFTSGSATHAYNGKALTNDEVTVSGDGFAEGEGASYEVTGSRTVTGISDNCFEYTLNEGTKAGNYDITKVYGKLNVTNRDAKYVLTMNPNGGTEMYDGEEHSVSGFISTKAVVDGDTYEVSGLEATASGTDAGTYDVSVTGNPVVKDASGNDVTDQFSVVTESAILTITPRSVLLRSSDESFEYDGKAHTGSGKVTEEGDGFVKGEGVDITPTASRILVGATENSFDWAFSEGTKAGNYNVETAYGLLSVVNREARYEIDMEANSDTVEYDGEEHSVSGFKTNEFDIDGNKFTVENVEAVAAGTDAGVYTTDISGIAEVKDKGGNDVTEQFAVTYKSGTLTITPAESSDKPGSGVSGTVGDTGSKDGKGGDSGSADGKSSAGGTDERGLDIQKIIDSGVPVTNAPSGYWGIANLILMIISVLLGIYMLFIRRKEEGEYEEDEPGFGLSARRRLISAVVAVVLAVLSAVIFFITEDFSNSVALFDRYTWLMTAITACSIVTVVFGRKDKKA